MESLSGKRVLVTGATGFIGGHLVRRLVQEGALVHALVRRRSDGSAVEGLPSSVRTHELDLTDEAALSACITEVKPEGVFHLAAVNQSFGNVSSLSDLIAVNTEATLRLMELCKEEQLLFFVNTDTFVQVGAKSHPIREDDVLEPTELYGISRVPGTLCARMLGKSQALPYITLRVFTPYGPFVQKGKIHYTLITKALLGEKITLTDPAVTRDFIYIDDLIDLYLLAALRAKEYPGEVFNAGTGQSTTLEALAGLVLAAAGSKSSVEYVGGNVSYDAARWQADTSKVEELLGWRPSVSLVDGVERTVAWFGGHEDYWRTV
jgi:nucleoside-diphosphate-sugar epimerase